MKNPLAFLLIIFLVIISGLNTVLFSQIDNKQKWIDDDVTFNDEDTIFLPHFGNNKVLDELLLLTNSNMSSNKSAVNSSEKNSVSFYIPLKIWLYHDDNGSNAALTYEQVYELIDNVNLFFTNNNTGIQFYLKCEIENVYSTVYNTIDNHNEFDKMCKEYDEQKTINCHIVENTSQSFGGLGSLPWDNDDNFRLMIVSHGSDLSTYTDYYLQCRTKALAHELGHTLGLLHTHENIRGSGSYNGSATDCYQESVSRTRTQNCLWTMGEIKCEINGDALCDTEAAPNTDSNDYIIANNSTDCIYTGGGTDIWGDAWMAPSENIMSYIDPYLCMKKFTNGQVGVMHSSIILYMFDDDGIWYNQHIKYANGNINSSEFDTVFASYYLKAANGGTNYTIQSGGSSYFQAAENIKLLPGFHAFSGSHFNAGIHAVNCNNINDAIGQSYTSGIDKSTIDYCKQILVDALIQKNPEQEDLYLSTFYKQNVLITDHIKIYPNPSSGKFTVEFITYNDSDIFIEIFDVLANKIFDISIPPNTEVQLDLSRYNNGLYFLKFNNGTETVVEKIIVQ